MHRSSLFNILVIVTFLSGWLLLTWGLVELMTWQVWLLSGGLLFLGITGYQFIYIVFRFGLFKLAQGIATEDDESA